MAEGHKAEQPKAPAISKSDRWKYEDPNPQDRGILLSNQIHELCEQNLLISAAYELKNLRPASYTLRIGDDFIDSDGNVRHFTDKEDTFVFQKNSIIFVSTKERLDIPFYIIARFNIRVNWVYDGVLLGTGPQVDPGFSGYLSCPLYNLTNGDMTIKRGQDFATIDFEKTTTLLDGTSLEKKKEVIAKAEDKHVICEAGQTYSFYKSPPFAPLQQRKSHKIVSSLLEMKEEVRTWRSLGIGSLIAFFGLTLSLLAFGANLYRQNSDLSRQYTDLSRQLTDDKNDLSQAKEKISKLESDVDRLSSFNKQAQPTSAPANPTEGKKNSQ